MRCMGGGGGEDPSVTTPHFARIFFHSDSIFSATQSVRDGVPQCSFSNFFEIKRNKNDSPIPRRRVNATNVYVLNKSRDFEEDDGFDMCLKCILSGQKECNIEFNSLVFAYEHFYYYYAISFAPFSHLRYKKYRRFLFHYRDASSVWKNNYALKLHEFVF